MGFFQNRHVGARLADAAANAEGDLHIYQGLVVGHEHVGPLTDPDPSFQVDAAGHQGVVFGEELLHVQDDPVTQEAALPLVEHARGNLVEDELVLPHVDRVTGVGAALVAGDEIRLLREDVDDLSLPLVSPLTSDDDGAPSLVRSSGHAHSLPAAKTKGDAVPRRVSNKKTGPPRGTDLPLESFGKS